MLGSAVVPVGAAVGAIAVGAVAVGVMSVGAAAAAAVFLRLLRLLRRAVAVAVGVAVAVVGRGLVVGGSLVAGRGWALIDSLAIQKRLLDCWHAV